MALQELVFAGLVVTLYAAIFLTFAISGNILVGHKPADLLYPFSKDFGSHFGTKDRPAILYFIYYLAFFSVLAVISIQIMTLRSSIRDWLDKMLGAAPRVEGASNHPALTSSASSVSDRSTPGHTDASDDEGWTEVKRKKKKKAKKMQNKTKVPNVMRSSVVDPKNQIIPSLPRLSMREDTTEKLSRVLLKFEDMDKDDIHEDIKAHLMKK